MCKYFPNIFFSISSSKIFAAVYLRVCSTGPLLFSHPSASLLELQLKRAIKNVCLLWMINSDQIYARKWNWRNVVSKYSIWNNSYLPKMGGEVVILANSLISHFQWGLRHSALLLEFQTFKSSEVKIGGCSIKKKVDLLLWPLLLEFSNIQIIWG